MFSNLNNDEEDIASPGEENTSCFSSSIWRFLLDPVTFGTLAGGTASTVACSTGASCNTTFAVGIGFWAGVPMTLCFALGLIKACSGNTAETPPTIGPDLCVNKVPSLLFHCCHGSEESTTASASTLSSRQSSSMSSLLTGHTPGQTHSPYGSTSRASLLSRSSGT